MERSEVIRQPAGHYLVTVMVVYLFFEFFRPQDFIGPLSVLRIPMMLVLFLAGSWLFGPKTTLTEKGPLLFIGFLTVIAISFVKANNHFFVFKSFETMGILFVSFCLPFVQYVNSKIALDRVFRGWILINVFLAIYVILHGGVGPGGFVKDENDVSLVLNMALPFCYLLSSANAKPTKRHKLLYRIAFLIIFSSVVLTFSRGGFLGLVAVGGYLWWRSERRVKNALVIAVSVAIFSGAALKVLPPGYLDEMSSISNTTDNTRVERIYTWDIGWEMFKRNPVLGVGAGNFRFAVATYQRYSEMYDPSGKSLGGREAHSLYFTLLPELGLAGVLVFGLLIREAFSKLTRAEQMRRTDMPGQNDSGAVIAAYALSTKCALISFFVSAAFISVLYYPALWVYLSFALAIGNVAIRESMIEAEDVQVA